MDGQRAPFQYPGVSTINAGVDSSPLSPVSRLPEYNNIEESIAPPPPGYAEELSDTATEDEDLVKKEKRKLLFIRLLTSIFVTVLVALIVAAVVAKIDHDSVVRQEACEDDSG